MACHPRWEALLAWLSSHGMRSSPLVQPRARSDGAGYGLYAAKTIPPSTALFTIPASAIITISTLSHNYPSARPKLTAIQLISLHLCLYRPVGLQDSSDSLFGPYISTLPNNFDYHPLAWFCHDKAKKAETRLLSALPPSAMDSLNQLASRFYADWKTVCQYLQENPSLLSLKNTTLVHPLLDNYLLEKDYIWAWLNVNTRCVYYRLKPSRSDPDNMALCPILDFANHTPLSTHMSPLLPDSRAPSTFSHVTEGDYTLLSPAAVVTLSDSELFLTYGPHSNKTLFIEYGFINQSPNIGYGDLHGEVDVQANVECLFEERDRLGDWMKHCLMDEGYWGDWTLHSSPPPARPSYRLITALRLYHLFPMAENDAPPHSANAIQPWQDTLLGKQEIISEQNEDAWKKTLLSICQSVADNASTGRGRCRDYWGTGSWVNAMKGTVEALWEEEYCIAMAVSDSIHHGTAF